MWKLAITEQVSPKERKWWICMKFNTSKKKVERMSGICIDVSHFLRWNSLADLVWGWNIAMPWRRRDGLSLGATHWTLMKYSPSFSPKYLQYIDVSSCVLQSLITQTYIDMNVNFLPSKREKLSKNCGEKRNLPFGWKSFTLRLMPDLYTKCVIEKYISRQKTFLRCWYEGGKLRVKHSIVAKLCEC